jgi:hypothetical protein
LPEEYVGQVSPDDTQTKHRNEAGGDRLPLDVQEPFLSLIFITKPGTMKFDHLFTLSSFAAVGTMHDRTETGKQPQEDLSYSVFHEIFAIMKKRRTRS